MTIHMPPATTSHDRPSDDGFTLIEVVVSLTLVALLMTGMAGMFYSAMRVAATANRRTEATSIATRELEAMRALPYPTLGFYTDQSPSDAGMGTNVILGTTAPGDVLLAPTGTAKPGPTTFSINRHVVWADGKTPSNASLTSAYKRTRVTVSWSDPSGSHVVRQDSAVYPGSCGEHVAENSCGAAASPTVGTAPNQPTGVVSVTPGDPAVAPSAIDVAWTPPAAGITPAGYIVEIALDPTGPWVPTPQQAATATSVRVSPLASSTPYQFRVRTVASDGMYSVPSTPLATATTAAASSGGCVVSGLRVGANDFLSTTKTYLSQGTNLMTEDLTLHVSTNGGCATTPITVKASKGPTADPGSPWTPIRVAGGFSKVAATDGVGGWSAGLHTFEVIRNGSASGVTHTFLVCQYKNLGERSKDPSKC